VLVELDQFLRAVRVQVVVVEQVLLEELVVLVVILVLVVLVARVAGHPEVLERVAQRMQVPVAEEIGRAHV
jgi:hypothetical protein